MHQIERCGSAWLHKVKVITKFCIGSTLMPISIIRYPPGVDEYVFPALDEYCLFLWMSGTNYIRSDLLLSFARLLISAAEYTVLTEQT